MFAAAEVCAGMLRLCATWAHWGSLQPSPSRPIRFLVLLPEHQRPAAAAPSMHGSFVLGVCGRPRQARLLLGDAGITAATPYLGLAAAGRPPWHWHRL